MSTNPPPSTSTPATSATDATLASATAADDPQCLVCHKFSIEYGGSSCGCPTLCRKCAMKQGTGGKCRTCHQMFGDVKRVVK
ncbi:hypothetical protein BCR44DRAFT_65896 [Catenaria anguillulae PL171]|uniref:RING-type domain-containing protein n=1 Tax=Catenaria anguillulae PL171 TaxID=765915 RepID=A0A1Y2HYV9_9FUNG|nr:hypothetical protein BCR44DRAFT_65896 [Catenaria anguillulae PL171]